MIPSRSRAALDELVRRDPDLAGIERDAGPLPWRSRAAGFPGLLQAIMGQQISNQAAAAIWRRLAALPGALTPAGLLALDDAALRGAGLSRPKVEHSRALATAFLNGSLSTEGLALMDDEAAVAAMSAVRGLGRWTAEVVRAGMTDPGYPVKRLYQATLPAPAIALARKYIAAFRNHYPADPARGLPPPTIAVPIAREAAAKHAVLEAHRSQVKVIDDVQPGGRELPAWLYYRLFDREYFALAAG